jgi:hypothetical protein
MMHGHVEVFPEFFEPGIHPRSLSPALLFPFPGSFAVLICFFVVGFT